MAAVGKLLGLPVALAAVALITGCGSASRHVSGPPNNASPQRVVAAYVAAINAHDVAKARHFLTPAHAAQVNSETDSWFTNVRSIKHLDTFRSSPDQSDARRLHYRFGVVVGTRFVLKQYKVESMSNGPNVWTFFLVRNNASQPWRIGDEGLG